MIDTKINPIHTKPNFKDSLNLPDSPTSTQFRRIKIHPKFNECNTLHLTTLIADMFTILINYNDKLPQAQLVTPFQSQSIPNISIHKYISRMVKYLRLEKSVLLMIPIYADRLCHKYPSFVISSLTIHRFVLTCITIAVKCISDDYPTSKFIAKVGGISLKELNFLEIELCKLLDWNLSFNGRNIQNYYMNLIECNSNYVIDPLMETNDSGDQVVDTSDRLEYEQSCIIS
ncbi:cyclin-domain-containing protein [Globomyces pollinis-pini]|nr:cyclin-domain-containing protein [Globomyces pollinis-pini]